MSDTTWPDRPGGFYSEWPVFAAEGLSQIVRSGGGRQTMAAALVSASALLGSAALVEVVRRNRAEIEGRATELGMPQLFPLLLGGSAVVGGAAGGLGAALVQRMLSRATTETLVTNLSDRLTRARRDFEELQQDVQGGHLDSHVHRAAVEVLFMRVTSPLAG